MLATDTATTLPQLIFTSMNPSPNWGPNGESVYQRTYQRVKPDGTKESWDDTVRRVVKGNLSLVPGDRTYPGEEEELYDLIYNFRVLPAGRHLWMSGVPGRQFLFNCYVSGWGGSLSDHFAFTFNQLMEGGGVGANYSGKYLEGYGINNLVRVHIVCSPEHANYEDLSRDSLLSSEYSSDYTGAIEVEDSREGWVNALTQVINKATEWAPEDAVVDSQTGQYLPELVFDVSNIREAGKRIKTFGGTSAGPVPFAKMLTGISHLLNQAWVDGFNGPYAMEMDHLIATCVVSGNVRRSARMSIMHWNDPWIDWFLKCKEFAGDHWSTNISVEIDDEFIDYVNRPSNDGDPIVDKARRVYDAIIDGMLANGEPGIWNSSLANVGEPNRVISTNPCGEICLEDWENCNLGHVNLDAFVGSDGSVDLLALANAHRLITRFLIRATFGDITDEKTRAKNDRNRRIGVGHFGYSGFVAKQKILFAESHRNETVRHMLTAMAFEVDSEAISYAHELRIPVPVKSRTIAPTGTIAKLAGRGEGIHPEYARYFIQRIRYSTVDPSQAEKLQEYKEKGYNIIPDPDTPYTMVVEIPTKNILVQELEDLGIPTMYLQTVDEISLYDMLSVQKMYQELWADNAVSFTVNIRDGHVTHSDMASTLKGFLSVLKGTTVFPDRSRDLAPYQRVTLTEFESLRASQGATEAVGDAYDEACATGACAVR